MSTEYKNNHYVPVWYQRRFLPAGRKDNELLYLDLNPGTFTTPNGLVKPRKALRRLGFDYCFSEDDLYTSRFGGRESREIEKLFFGAIDNRGRQAVKYFDSFAHPSADGHAFQDLVSFMSTQKLRTPKGLAWLTSRANYAVRDAILALMTNVRDIYCATWTECVWQIADASNSATKFIVSDHPVTVYNRRCGPRSQWCRGIEDPDIRFHATHTLFPLSLGKLLILTNLSWARNPYQSPVEMRPNPNLFRSAVFKFTDIQTLRFLNEDEVRQINFIIKTRAHRYIAAAEEAWLYPERWISKSNWAEYGQGYLLMPDPRPIHMGGTVFWGGGPGGSGGLDEYGRAPWDPNFQKESKGPDEGKTLYRFKGEFARLFGPKRRGRTFHGMDLDDEEDDAEFHQYHLDEEQKFKNAWKVKSKK
jgi:hypothetical protein